VDNCLEDVSRYIDILECEKAYHLDSYKVFKRGDSGSLDTAVMRKAEREGGRAEV